jgi:hypothetical protein
MRYGSSLMTVLRSSDMSDVDASLTDVDYHQDCTQVTALNDLVSSQQPGESVCADTLNMFVGGVAVPTVFVCRMFFRMRAWFLRDQMSKNPQRFKDKFCLPMRVAVQGWGEGVPSEEIDMSGVYLGSSEQMPPKLTTKKDTRNMLMADLSLVGDASLTWQSPGPGLKARGVGRPDAHQTCFGAVVCQMLAQMPELLVACESAWSALDLEAGVEEVDNDWIEIIVSKAKDLMQPGTTTSSRPIYISRALKALAISDRWHEHGDHDFRDSDLGTQMDARDFLLLVFQWLPAECMNAYVDLNLTIDAVCGKCKMAEEYAGRLQPTSCMLLQVPQGEGLSVKDLLEARLLSLRADGSTSFPLEGQTCRSCHTVGAMCGNENMASSPLYLPICLLRFFQDERTKNRSPVCANLELSIPVRNGPPTAPTTIHIYDLVFVAHHIGSTLARGHYNCDLLRHGVWQRIDDGSSWRMPPHNIERGNGDSYLLLYKRRV